MAQYGGNNQYGYGQNNHYNQQAGNPYAQSGNPYSQPQPSGNPYAQQQPNPYAQQQSNSYGQQQSNPYGQQQSNPYAQQQSTGYGQQDGTQQPSSNPYGRQGAQNGTYAGANDVEMGQMNGQPQQNDDVSLAQDALDVERAVKTLKTDNVTQIARLHQQTLSETDPEQRKRISRQLDALRAETNATYKNLVSRLNKLKGKPGAGSERNQPQIMRVQRVINAELQAFNDLQSKQRKAEAELIERQIRGVVNKGTTEQQIQEMVHEAVESGNQDIYAQATLNSARTGQVRAVLNENRERSEGIRKIERSLMEVVEMMAEVNRIVQEQEVQVTKIDQSAQDTEEQIRGGVDHTIKAVDKARAARRKKWICLGIVVAIILVIVIAIVAWYFTVGPGAKPK